MTCARVDKNGVYVLRLDAFSAVSTELKFVYFRILFPARGSPEYKFSVCLLRLHFALQVNTFLLAIV